MCFCLASSWFMMPAEVFSTMDRSKLFCHFSRSLGCTSNMRLHTCLLAREVHNSFPSCMINDFKFMDVTIITVRNWSLTLEHALIRTWHLPLLLALLMLLIAPAKTFMRTIMATLRNGGKRTGGVSMQCYGKWAGYH